MPSSQDQNPNMPGTAAGEQSVSPEHHRRSASRVSEFGFAVDPVTCPQTTGHDNTPGTATPPHPPDRHPRPNTPTIVLSPPPHRPGAHVRPISQRNPSQLR